MQGGMKEIARFSTNMSLNLDILDTAILTMAGRQKVIGYMVYRTALFSMTLNDP